MSKALWQKITIKIIVLTTLILGTMMWGKTQTTDRRPAVAGQFYPADPVALDQMLEDLFSQAKPKKVSNTLAIISPHAGYVFSGVVAASSFNQIDTDRDYQNIFLIGTSHHTYLSGASIYDQGDYIMPWGKVKVNTKLAKKLINQYEFFTYDPNAHLHEHSLEVQLPFLHYKLKNKNYQIVPVIIGTNNINTLKKIAQALEPYFNSNNLFVISTDFSHYPPYEQAKQVDRITAEAILTKNPDYFLQTIEKNKQLGIPNLATSICGWSSVYVLMQLANTIPDSHFEIIDYRNSGDAIYGDHSQVVGYYAIALVNGKNTNTDEKMKDTNKFTLTDEDKKMLLAIARTTIESYIKNGTIPQFDTSNFSKALKTPAGAFVTLKINGKLRGCIGRFMPGDPLWKVVQDMSIAAATDDPRFSPVTPDELDKILIEISVLTPLERVNSPEDVIVGKHGVYCRSGFQSGTLLPQVATEQGWDAEEFVRYCCKYKAGLDSDCWKHGELYVYEAIVFDETEF